MASSPAMTKRHLPVKLHQGERYPLQSRELPPTTICSWRVLLCSSLLEGFQGHHQGGTNAAYIQAGGGLGC